tara:strand:- start:502 stop:1398 length:897 start_codon:yes stop_codon:yes gene_type:complete
MYLIYAVLAIFFIIVFFYIRKKIKKYKLIYKTNGFDGIYYYFINKNSHKIGLSNFIDKKKNILGKKISKYSKQKILSGPYIGTKIIYSSGWSNIDFAPKYLGTYEKQVQEQIIFLKKKFKLTYFVDLGAAEGYHLVSLLKKKIFKTGQAYEIEKISRDILLKNATINKVNKQISIHSEANFNSLKINLKNINQKKILFLVDIEGGEFDLFNEEFCKYFSKSFFIIEDHSFNILNKNKISNFYNNINKYFKLFKIKDNSKNPFEFSILDDFSDDEKYLMMSEGRPKTMQWIILYPKKIK